MTNGALCGGDINDETKKAVAALSRRPIAKNGAEAPEG
jgi:hypothetical protein